MLRRVVPFPHRLTESICVGPPAVIRLRGAVDCPWKRRRIAGEDTMRVRESPRQIQIESSVSPVIAHCRPGRRCGGSSLHASRGIIPVIQIIHRFGLYKGSKAAVTCKIATKYCLVIMSSRNIYQKGDNVEHDSPKENTLTARSLLRRYPAGTPKSIPPAVSDHPEVLRRGHGRKHAPSRKGAYIFKDNISLYR